MPCTNLIPILDDCNQPVGGTRKLYLTNWDNVVSTGYTVSVDGVITAITTIGSPSPEFVQMEFKQTNMNATEALTKNVAAGTNGGYFYAQDINLFLNKRDSDKRNALAILAAESRILAIVQEADGSFWLYGKGDGLYLSSSAHATGAQKADANGYTMVFHADELEQAQEVSSSAVTSVTT